MLEPETKIVAMHRLQKDGRWDEASEYRCEQRRKFRAEGRTKKEAGERAWAAMIEKFPEDDDAFVDLMAMSYLPPLCLDPKSASFFSVYCRVRAVTHLCCSAEWMAEADNPTTEPTLEKPQTALPLDLPERFNERFNELLPFAFEHPVDFLGHCSEALEEAADKIPDDALGAEAVRGILMDFVVSMPMFQYIVRKRFAGALCP